MLKAAVHWVSPRIRKSQLPAALSIDDKIKVFADRVLGWQLEIADQLYHGPFPARGRRRLKPRITHNGFAVLYIILSYFEMIPKYEDGDLSEVSGEWFKRGLKRVFPELIGHVEETAILVAMWKGARNGLYHSAMTKSQVFISGDAVCLDYDPVEQRLVVNPGAVVRRIIQHFEGYVTRLRDPAQNGLRVNFLTKFDHDILPQIT